MLNKQMLDRRLTDIVLTHKLVHTHFHTSSPAAAVLLQQLFMIDFYVCISALNTAIYFSLGLANCLQLSAHKPPAYGAAPAGYLCMTHFHSDAKAKR